MKGQHLIMDLYDCSSLILEDHRELSIFIIELIEKAGMRLVKLCEPIIYDDFDSKLGWGISLVAILSDSHVTIHTAPSRRASAFLDIYSCNTFDKNYIEKFIVDRFKSTYYKIHSIERNCEL